MIRNEQKNQDSRGFVPRNRNNNENCAECGVKPGIGYCRSCGVKYCTPCFGTIHSHSRILRKHTLEMETSKKPKLKRRVHDNTIEYYVKRICKIHKYHFNFFCKKCSKECCKSCVKNDHNSHYCVTISEENMRSRGDIDLALEFLKNAEEKVRQTQMSVKFTEKQFANYAMETCEEISGYFHNLHKFLQNKERTIMDYFKNKSEKPQKFFQNALIQIGKSEENLNKIRSALEYFQQAVPTNFIIKDILEDYYNDIENLSCTINVLKFERNPFSVRLSEEALHDFSKFIEYSYIEQENLQYGETDMKGNQSKSNAIKGAPNQKSSSTKMIANKRQKNESNCEYFASNSMQTLSVASLKGDTDLSQEMGTLSIRDDDNSPNVFKNLVKRLSTFTNKDEKLLVTSIKSPFDFFVQNETVLNIVKNIANDYKNLHDTIPLLPFKIKINKDYMIYIPKEERWYRGKVLKSRPNKSFSCLLVDYGVHIETNEERLLKTSNELDNIPYAALHCSIYGIVPANLSKWSDKDNFIFRELTSEKYFSIDIINTNAEKLEIDLIAYDSPKRSSVRDALLYTGIAIDKTLGKKGFPTANKSERIKIDKLPCNVVQSVRVLHVDDPFEFYVSMTKDNHNYRNMMDQMNHEFRENRNSNCSNIIYNGSLKQACMCIFQGKVYRGCIEEIHPKGIISVRFVDEGTTKDVRWDQLYILPDHYKEVKEFSFKCSLTDIEPLQSDNYVWSKDALVEFKTLMRNKDIFLGVITYQNDHYKVNMFVEKGCIPYNIGALLVTKDLAVSTGPSTMTLDTPLPSNKFQADLLGHTTKTLETKGFKIVEKFNKNNNKSENKPNRLENVKKTNVIISHMVDPGEFYVIRTIDFNGVKIFNEHIQNYMKQIKLNSSTISQFTVKDDCLVLTTLKTSCKPNIFHSHSEVESKWYRGQIRGINFENSPQTTYTVFLRDIGVLIYKISENSLHPMPNDFKNISDAAYRCHLACIKPFDESSIWPKNAIEFFKKLLLKFEGFQVTMQSKRDTVKKSFPVIVWGIQTKATTALEPFVTNYTNFIRLFVVNRMAKMTERLDFTKEMNKMLNIDLLEDEISWDDYIKDSLQISSITTEIRKNFNDLKIKYGDDSFIDDDCRELLDHLNDLNEDITTSKTQIPRKWLESRIITKTFFGAFPTYVDYQANIYLYEYNIQQILDTMSQKIHQKYVPMLKNIDQNNQQYGCNQPCLVRYHSNNQYYRGIIQKSKESKQYEVFFVDFGNIEECDSSELLPFAPFKELPSLCSKYYLVNIKPKNGKTKHTIEFLDALHKMLVGVTVNVQVTGISSDDESTPCRIRLNGMDVAKILVDYGYVDWISEEPSAISKDSPSKIIKESQWKKNLSLIHNNEYDKLFKYNAESSSMNLDTQSDYKNELFYSSLLNTTTITNFVSPKKIAKGMKFKSETDISLKPTASVKPLYDSRDYQEFFKTQKMFNNPKFIDDIIDCEMEELEMNVLDDLDDEYRKPNKVREDKMAIFGNMFIDDINDYDSEMEMENCNSVNLWNQDEFISLKFDEDEEEHQFLLSLENASKTAVSPIDLDTFNSLSVKDSVNMNALTTSIFSDSEKNFSWLSSFIPNDTSTVITTFSSLNSLKPIQLPIGVKKFPCEVSYMASPISFYIFPNLTDFCYRFKELRKAINYEISKNKLQDLEDLQIGTFCLACFSKDKLWYRAVIRSINPQADTVDVLYVDYLNSESLKRDQLRKISRDLIEKWPARVMKVHFPDVKLNPNITISDARSAFKKALNNNHKAYAQIKLPKNVKNNDNVISRSLLSFEDHLASTSLPNMNFDLNYDAEHDQDETDFLSTPIDLFEDKTLKKSITKELLKQQIFLKA